MARFARLVVPGYPHHITQRGVRSIDIFSDDRDRHVYLRLMAEESERFGVTFLAWCLMPNHVHLIAIPKKENSLARAIGEAHRRYTNMKNQSDGVRGYLFQGRFGSCVMDQQHLLAAGRYVERNPVVAKIVAAPTDYQWSSCRYHCNVVNTDPLVSERNLPDMVDNWSDFLMQDFGEKERTVQKRTKTGRPAGEEKFIHSLEGLANRELLAKKPGRRRA